MLLVPGRSLSLTRRGGLSTPIANRLFSLYASQGFAWWADFQNDNYALPSLGAERVTNGNASNGLSGWVEVSDTGNSIQAIDGRFTATISATGSARIRQQITGLAVGQVYRISRSVGFTSNISLAIGTTSGGSDVLTFSPEGVRFFTAPATSVWINLATSTSGGQITDISLREILSTPRPATRAEWFARFSSASGPGRAYTDAGGIVRNDLAVDQPRFGFSRGGRQRLYVFAQSTRMHGEFPLHSVRSGNLGTLTQLPAEGVFSPVRFEGVGAEWHRANNTNCAAVVSGQVYGWRVRYRAGGGSPSGRCRITFRLNTLATESRARGPIGALAADNEAAGAVVVVGQLVHSNGDHEVFGTWTPNGSDSNPNMGVGPDSLVSGQSIEIVGGQLTSLGHPFDGWIFGGTGQVTRQAEIFRAPEIVEALVSRSEATVVARAGDLLGGTGAARLIGGVGGNRLIGTNASMMQIAFGGGTYYNISAAGGPGLWRSQGEFGVAVRWNDVTPSRRGAFGHADGTTAMNAAQAEVVGVTRDQLFIGRDQNGGNPSGVYFAFVGGFATAVADNVLQNLAVPHV